MSRKLIDPYDIALNFIKYRFRSQLEIEQKLKRKKIQPSQIKKVINRLKGEKLIDDEQFAHLWIRNRINLKPTGSRLLLLELRQKGIDRDLAYEILRQELPEDLEKDLAYEIGEAKYQKLKSLPPFDQKQKLLSFLSRRGFDYSISRETVEKIFGA